MNIEYEREFTEKLNSVLSNIEHINDQIVRVENELKKALPSDYDRSKCFGYPSMSASFTKAGNNVTFEVTCLSDEDKHNIIRYILNKVENRLNVLYEERRRAIQQHTDLLLAYE